MMLPARYPGAVAIALALAATAVAGGAPAAALDQGTIVTFTVRAETSLARDRLVADIAVEGTDKDAAHLQDTLNRRMATALARAKAVAAVTATTGDYNVYEERPEKGPPVWHGRQALQLAATDQPALLHLVGALQADGFILNGLAAAVSPAAERAVEDKLTDAALARMRARAQRIAAAMDLKLTGYRRLNIGNVAAPPLPVRPLMAMTAREAAPVVAPGAATVGVSVTAEIALGPR